MSDVFVVQDDEDGDDNDVSASSHHIRVISAMDEVEEGENSVVEHHGSRSEAVFLCVVCCVCCVHLWAHSPSVCIGDAASAEVSATPPGNGGR